MSVFVVDTNKVPLAPCHEAKARKLLDAGKAAIYRKFPFSIILKYSVESPMVPDLRIKLDPGSRTTGIAVVDDQSVSRLCSRVGSSWAGHQKELRRSARFTQRQTSTPYPLSKATMAEQKTTERLVTTIATEPDQQCAHLGTTLGEGMSHHKHQYGVGQVRHATPRKC